jgi:hypothetical protein
VAGEIPDGGAIGNVPDADRLVFAAACELAAVGESFVSGRRHSFTVLSTLLVASNRESGLKATSRPSPL